MGLHAVQFSDGNQLGKLFLAKCLMRPDILPVGKKIALNKDNALKTLQSVDLPGTLVLVIFEV